MPPTAHIITSPRFRSPRDAQLAHAYAVECEDQAREASSIGPRSARSAIAQSVGNLIPNSVGRGVVISKK
jgi:hypothetical protein